MNNQSKLGMLNPPNHVDMIHSDNPAIAEYMIFMGWNRKQITRNADPNPNLPDLISQYYPNISKWRQFTLSPRSSLTSASFPTLIVSYPQKIDAELLDLANGGPWVSASVESLPLLPSSLSVSSGTPFSSGTSERGHGGIRSTKPTNKPANQPTNSSYH